MDFNLSISALNITQPLSKQEFLTCCTNENVYKYMDHYPEFAFYSILVGFVFLVLYMYLPLVFKTSRLSFYPVVERMFFIICFFGVGMGLFAMIPVVYTLSESVFKLIPLLQNIFMGITFLVAVVVLVKYIKKNG